MTSDADRLRGNAVVKSLRRNLGDDANNPIYIRTVPRAGYRMAEAGMREQKEA